MLLQFVKLMLLFDRRVPRPPKRHGYIFNDCTGPGAQNIDAVGEIDGLVHIMGDKKDRTGGLAPDPSWFK
jgi:hypothetical protein